MRLINDDALAIVTIYMEARGEHFEGKLGVAEVILNRQRQKPGRTVAHVVARAFQFSGWNTRDHNRIPSLLIDDELPVVKECREAWRAAKDGTELTEGATHYMNVKLVMRLRGKLPKWVGRMEETVKIGAHTFYKRKK